MEFSILILTIVQTIVAVIGVPIIIFQLYFSRKQTLISIEKTIREKTVEMMLTWTQTLQKETSFAERIVCGFSEPQCLSLYDQKAFEVSKEIKNNLCEICPHAKSDYCEQKCKSDSSPNYLVEGLQLSELRWYIIQYLNSLESVMVAWQQGVVDRGVIEEQFAGMFGANRGYALEKFRKVVCDGAAYPITEEFHNHLKEKKKQTPSATKKPQLGK